jgi:glycosyltransferase involved in cell wall biosynthesis
MSLAMLEAMSCGRSIVANATQGVERFLNGAGEVVAIGDQRALASALIRRFTEPELVAAEEASARAVVESHFHWDRLVQEANEVYLGVMSDQP